MSISTSALPLFRMVRQIGHWRVAVAIAALIMAVLVARDSWYLQPFIDAEHALFDARIVAGAPLVHQDSRIVLVPYTDETLITTAKRSPLDRTVLAHALARLDKMSAKAIGIDIFIDQPQPDDPLLIDTLRRMRTPTFLAYALATQVSDKMLYRQQQFIEQFRRAIASPNVRLASVMLKADSDNVMRRWGDPVPAAPPRLPNAMVPQAGDFATYNGSLAYRRPAQQNEPLFATIPIDTFASGDIFQVPGAADLLAAQIRGRYVLIGGNIEDIDIFQTPLSRAAGKGESKSTWGMDLFGVALAQILDGRLPEPMSNLALWAMAVGVVAAGAFTAGVQRRPLISVPIMAGQLLGLAGIPFWLADRGAETYGLPAFGWLVGWFLAFTSISVAARALTSEQRRFAQGALGKYLPRDIAERIIRDPDSLQLRGEKREIFIMFCDLEGFTPLSHALEPEMVATLLNRYLDRLSDVVLSHGGTIDKFVGDAVVAFWGAPISRPDDGRRAVEAAMAIYQAGEKFRQDIPLGLPPVGGTRVGLHWGHAIVGNFGGKGRIQYTALGDAMNTASRLESANKQTGTYILVSGPVVERCGLDIFRPLGRVVLSGRTSALDIYEPVPDMPAIERNAFAELVHRSSDGEAAGVAQIVALAEHAPHDKALNRLAFRLMNQRDKNYYVLDAK